MIAWLRDRLFGITQTEARKRLKAATADLHPPGATVDQHGRPREGWDVPDGREVMRRKVRTLREWTQQYDDRRQAK